MARADRVVWRDMPVAQRLWRVVKRGAGCGGGGLWWGRSDLPAGWACIFAGLGLCLADAAVRATDDCRAVGPGACGQDLDTSAFTGRGCAGLLRLRVDPILQG